MQTVGPPHLRLVSALAEPTIELCKFEFLFAVKKVEIRQDTESSSSNDIPYLTARYESEGRLNCSTQYSVCTANHR
jgi:hypothetical protein